MNPIFSQTQDNFTKDQRPNDVKLSWKTSGVFFCAATMNMNEFIKAGGMDTLLRYASIVEVGKLTNDPTDPFNYYVDIRFRLNSDKEAPFFGERDLSMNKGGERTSERHQAARKVLSIMSEEGDPLSTEVEVVNGPEERGAAHDGPVSESYTYEGSTEADDRNEIDVDIAPQETVYMPDAMWIARTQAISSILKPREEEEKDISGDKIITNVVSVRRVISAADLRNHTASFDGSVDSRKENDADLSTNLVASEHPTIVTDEDPDEDDRDPDTQAHKVSVEREHTLGEILGDPNVKSKLDDEFFNTITAKKPLPSQIHTASGDRTSSTAANERSTSIHGDRNNADEEVPQGCSLLRTSSLKAAVKSIRRSFSKERVSAGQKGTSSRSATHSDVNHNMNKSNLDANTREVKHNIAGAEIEPNPIAQSVQQSNNIPNKNPPVAGEAVEDRNDRHGDRTGKSGDGLFRKTSNIARNLFRKMSSSDAKTTKRGNASAEKKGEGDVNPPTIHKKRSVIFGRQKSQREA